MEGPLLSATPRRAWAWRAGACAAAAVLVAAWWPRGDPGPGRLPASVGAPRPAEAGGWTSPPDPSGRAGPVTEGGAATSSSVGRFPFAPGGDDILGSDGGLAPTRMAAGSRLDDTGPAGAVAEGAGGLAAVTGSAAAAPRPLRSQPLPDISAFPIAVAGDFFGDGRTALFAVVPDAAGVQRAAFLVVDRRGRWVDRSGDLLPAAERAACRQPRQALADDFNGDGRPDAYLVCSADGTAPCCRHWLYLSQPDGRYRRREVPAGWDGPTEAADLDGDGRIEVFPADQPAQALWGRGDGSFGADPRRYGRK